MRWLMVVAALALAGPAMGQTVIDGSEKALPDATLDIVKKAVSLQVKDPRSVQIRGLTVHPRTGAVCGYFNAKNSLGGYVDFLRFMYSSEKLFVEPEGPKNVRGTTRDLIDGLCEWR